MTLQDGRTEKIVQVLASKEFFRVASELTGPIVHDYSFTDIKQGKSLVASYDEGATWVRMDISPENL